MIKNFKREMNEYLNENTGKWKQRYEWNKENCLRPENGSRREEENINWR